MLRCQPLLPSSCLAAQRGSLAVCLLPASMQHVKAMNELGGAAVLVQVQLQLQLLASWPNRSPAHTLRSGTAAARHCVCDSTEKHLRCPHRKQIAEVPRMAHNRTSQAPAPAPAAPRVHLQHAPPQQRRQLLPANSCSSQSSREDSRGTKTDGSFSKPYILASCTHYVHRQKGRAIAGRFLHAVHK